jgi:hypothetical protein
MEKRLEVHPLLASSKLALLQRPHCVSILEQEVL